MEPRMVRTTTGLVRGKSENGLAVFRGIPFAQAPVGKLRFQAPVPYSPWNGVRDADSFGPPPPQASTNSTTSSGDEWLSVNVWSPDVKAARLPVLVWIYGGAFIIGSSSEPIYNGATLASHGAVVVSFNYRVSMEGFGRIEGAPTNRGLLDQIAALRWVGDNIAAFGGNPENITLFGQSAGAGSIAMLLAAPSARGLFHRAIAQSVPTALQSPELATDIATVVANQVDKHPTVAELTSIDPWTLARAAKTVSDNIPQHQDRWSFGLVVAGTPFGPVIDPESLPESPWQALARGASRDIALIVGHTRDEYNLMITASGGADTITAAHTEQALSLLPPIPDGPRAYRAAYQHASDEQLYQIACSDFLFRMPSLHLAQAHATGGGATYLYEFRYETKTMGAAHTAELPLLFGTLDTAAGERLYGNPPPQTAVALAEQIQTEWLSFAETGDPEWPTYTSDSQQARRFDTTSTTGRYPEQESQQIWAAATFDPLPLRQR
ncbi:carboxylesterase/lipase family protein [Nocardia sp. NPDC051570]|uniref:carboxylesterase/lipase family protein n=1 Tax=Nocardia sp. NPDC051570 TaxID=3364324 RepID=UPI00378F9ED7